MSTHRHVCTCTNTSINANKFLPAKTFFPCSSLRNPWKDNVGHFMLELYSNVQQSRQFFNVWVKNATRIYSRHQTGSDLPWAWGESHIYAYFSKIVHIGLDEKHTCLSDICFYVCGLCLRGSSLLVHQKFLLLLFTKHVDVAIKTLTDLLNLLLFWWAVSNDLTGQTYPTSDVNWWCCCSVAKQLHCYHKLLSHTQTNAREQRINLPSRQTGNKTFDQNML